MPIATRAKPMSADRTNATNPSLRSHKAMMHVKAPSRVSVSLGKELHACKPSGRTPATGVKLKDVSNTGRKWNFRNSCINLDRIPAPTVASIPTPMRIRSGFSTNRNQQDQISPTVTLPRMLESWSWTNALSVSGERPTSLLRVTEIARSAAAPAPTAISNATAKAAKIRKYLTPLGLVIRSKV